MASHIEPERDSEMDEVTGQNIKADSTDRISLHDVELGGSEGRPPLRESVSESALPKLRRTWSGRPHFGGQFKEESVTEAELAFPSIYSSPTYLNLKPHEFQVEWLCDRSIPFYKLRKLKNPWNDDRPVQIARDGIEISPEVGKELIGCWDAWNRQQ